MHGGGRHIERMLERLGIESRFVEGRRVTSAEAMDVVEMVLSGIVNKGLAAGLTAAGLPAVGLSGRDGGLIRARLEPGLGRVGTPEQVDVTPLLALVGRGLRARGRPRLVGSVGRVRERQRRRGRPGHRPRAAGAVPRLPLRRRRGAGGRRTAERLTLEEAEQRIADGTIAGGMVLKVRVALAASAAGIPEVVVAGRARLQGRFPGTVIRRRGFPPRRFSQ